MNKQPPKTLLQPGDIFQQVRYDYRATTKFTCWKVTGLRPPVHYFFDWGYLVIKCTKTGKEFKSTNGFSTNIDKSLSQPDAPVDQHFSVDYRIVKRGTTIGTKANLEPGITTGTLKRRIDYLSNRIEKDKTELVNLEGKLQALEYKS